MLAHDVIHQPNSIWRVGTKFVPSYPNGVLNVWNICLINEALLGTWLWRYGVEREALWRRVVGWK